MDAVLTIADRSNKINIITESLINIPDPILPDILKLVLASIKKKKKDIEDLSRFEKLQLIEKNLKYCDDPNIILIEHYITNKELEETKIEKLNRVMLEISNKLLEANGKPKIHEIKDFKMTRDQMLSDESKGVINENKNYIFEEGGFSKIVCKVGQTHTTHKHFSLFKGMVNQIEGYSLQSKLKFKTKNHERTSYTEYYVKQN